MHVHAHPAVACCSVLLVALQDTICGVEHVSNTTKQGLAADTVMNMQLLGDALAC